MSFSIPSDEDLNRLMLNCASAREFPESVNEQMKEMIERVRSIDCYQPRSNEISMRQNTLEECFNILSGLTKELEAADEDLEGLIAANQKLQRLFSSLQHELKQRKLQNRNVQPIYQWGERAANNVSKSK